MGGFTRSWTLQELVAPANIIFCAASWLEFGTKSALSGDLSTFTKVSEQILRGQRPVETATIANRMGWVSNRATTEPEDLAYSLMGILSVNMPLMHGEGASKAFFHLQQEVMKDSSDHTLFAWVDPNADDDQEYGMLAPSPSCFASTYNISPYAEWAERAPHSWTSKGLSIELHLRRTGTSDLFDAAMNCPPPDFEDSFFLCILLGKTSTAYRGFSRVRTSKLLRLRICPSYLSQNVFEGNYVREGSQRHKRAIDMVFSFHYLVLEFPFPNDVYQVANILIQDR